MKNIIATTLALGTSIILIAFVLKLMEWPIAVQLILIGLVADLVALGAYLAYRYQHWREHPRRKIAIIILVWGSLLVLMGSVFKLMQWPWSEKILLVGLAVEAIAMLTYFSVNTSRHLN